MGSEHIYSGMKKLLAGSFYQCWEEFEGRSADELLEDAIAESHSLELKKAIDDLNRVFCQLDETDVMKGLLGTGFGCNYSPKYEGKSEVEWLVELKQKLVSEMINREKK